MRKTSRRATTAIGSWGVSTPSTKRVLKMASTRSSMILMAEWAQGYSYLEGCLGL